MRNARKWHKVLGLSLALFLLISSITGVLLAWKKNVEILQPSTQKGSTKSLTDWKPIAELADLAILAITKIDSTQSDNPINRIDARPSKGIVKVLFKKGNWEVQLDAATGKTLSAAKRHADWIEQLHDGSIISDLFKLISMNFLGFGLLLLGSTGLWLWYGPKLIRRIKRKGAK